MTTELTLAEQKVAMAGATPGEGVDLLAGLPALEAFNLALEHPQPEQVISLLPVESAYLMLHEIGSEDALLLLELTSSDQVKGFIDIDCWDKDRFDIPKLRTWFLLLNELDDERFLRNLHAIDLALLVGFFERHVEVHKIEDLNDPIQVEGPSFLTPDGRYLVEYTCSVEQNRLINAVLVRIYDFDLVLFHLVFEALYWESGADVEEYAYQERNSRLSSRGFPDYFDALDALAVVNVERFKPQKKVAPPALAEEPGVKVSSANYLTHYEHPDSLLRRALAKDFPSREGVSVEIMGLANMAVVAAGVPFFELQAVRELVSRTDGYLSIGLEHRVGQDEEKAREQITIYRCIDIHKIGRSLVMRQARRARRLPAKIAIDGRSANKLLLDPPEGDVVLALLKPEPLYFDGETERQWSALAQVREAETVLDRIESLARLMEDQLGITPAALEGANLAATNFSEAAEVTFRVLFNTFRSHDLLGNKPSLNPLTLVDLRLLADLLVTDDAGRPELPRAQRDAFAQWLQSVAGETEAAMLRPLLDRFTAALVAELAREDIQPQFRRELLLRLR